MIDAKKCCMIAALALIVGFVVYGIANSALTTAQNNANITNVFEMVVNNTNLAPTIEPSVPGTGERIINVTYTATNYPLQLLVFAHGNSVSQTAGTFVYINDTLVMPQSGRPLGGAEEAYRGVPINVPKGSRYRVNFTNYHHYEWREYPILSGRNGTLSINQTVLGSSFNASYVPYIGANQNISVGKGYFSIISADGNSTVTIPNASIGSILLHQEGNPAFGATRNTTVSIDGVIGMETYDNTIKTNASYLLSDIQHIFKINNTIVGTINKTGLYSDYNITAKNISISTGESIGSLEGQKVNKTGETVFSQSMNFRNDSINDTIIRNYTPHYISFNFTRDLTTATGTQSITGIGFKPSFIDCTSVVNGAVGQISWGQSDGINGAVVYDDYNEVSNSYYSYTFGRIIQLVKSGTDYSYAKVNSFDVDGVTFGWTKVGSPTGTGTVVCKASR